MVLEPLHKLLASSGIHAKVTILVRVNIGKTSPKTKDQKPKTQSQNPYCMTQIEHDKFQRLITESPFARLLGFEVQAQINGRVRLRLHFTEQLLQALGRVHGGAIFALADHASGWAAVSTLQPGFRCATLEMKINDISTVHDEDCIAEASVVHSGRTSIVVEADVKTEAGRLIAKTLATFAVLNPKTEES